MKPTRWWRAVAPDGTVWCETSNLSQLLDLARPGDRIERLYEETSHEWRVAEPGPLSPG